MYVEHMSSLAESLQEFGAAMLLGAAGLGLARIRQMINRKG